MLKVFSGTVLIYWVLINLSLWVLLLFPSITQVGTATSSLCMRVSILQIVEWRQKRNGCKCIYLLTNISATLSICRFPPASPLKIFFLPRFNLAKKNFKICQLIHGNEIVLTPVTGSLFGSLSLSMKSERKMYWKPWRLMAEGFCQGPARAAPVKGEADWCGNSGRRHTASFPRPRALSHWDACTDADPWLHTRPTEAEFLGLGPAGLHFIQSLRWFWDMWA